MEQFETELCHQWQLPASHLRQYYAVIPKAGDRRHPLRGQLEPIYEGSEEDFDRWYQYAKILHAGCSVAQVQELIRKDERSVQAGKEGRLVEMYAMLADECYEGLTPHMLRSLCVVILYQNRLNKMLLSKDLAAVAGIREETALRHLIYLQFAAGALRFHTKPPRWEFHFTPKALAYYYPE